MSRKPTARSSAPASFAGVLSFERIRWQPVDKRGSSVQIRPSQLRGFCIHSDSIAEFLFGRIRPIGSPRGVNQFLLIRTIHEQLMVRNFQYSSMPWRRSANIQSNPLVAVTSAATSIARGQPNLVATKAVTIGASQPPKLPKVFIMEETEAL